VPGDRDQKGQARSIGRWTVSSGGAPSKWAVSLRRVYFAATAQELRVALNAAVRDDFFHH